MVWRSYLKRGCFCVAEKKYDNKSPWYRIQRRIQRRRDMKTWHVSSLTRRQSIALTWWEGVYGSISLCLTRHLPTVFPANCSWLSSLCNYLVVDSFRKSLPITSFHFEWLFSFGSSVLKKLKETWEDVIEIFLSQLRDICLLFSFWILSLFSREEESLRLLRRRRDTHTHVSTLQHMVFIKKTALFRLNTFLEKQHVFLLRKILRKIPEVALTWMDKQDKQCSVDEFAIRVVSTSPSFIPARDVQLWFVSVFRFRNILDVQVTF